MRERIDTDQVNGIGGALNNSTIDGLYIHHTKVGIWLDGPMHNVTISNTVIADQIADGINFHQGVTNSRVPTRSSATQATTRSRCGRRRSAATRRSRTRTTRSTTTPSRRPCSLTASRSTAAATTRCRTTCRRPGPRGQRPPRGARASARRRSPGRSRSRTTPTVRAGSFELNWKIGLGAIWLYALEGSLTADIEVDRRQLPAEHLQRDPDRVGLPGEGPLHDHERSLQGHPRRRDGHLGAERPRPPAGDVPERGRAQRRRRRHQQLRLVPLHAGRLGVLA